MTHRGPFQPLLFCDSVILSRDSACTGLICLGQLLRGAAKAVVTPVRLSLPAHGDGHGTGLCIPSLHVGAAGSGAGPGRSLGESLPFP